MQGLLRERNSDLYFDTNKRVYVLNFMFNAIEMRLCEFIALHKKLNAYDYEALMEDMSKDTDCHVFRFEKNNIILELNLLELTILQRIFSETMFAMKLEDLLYSLDISMPTEALDLEFA